MNKLTRRLSLAGITGAALLFLAGCVQTHMVNGVRVPTEAGMNGFTYRFIVTPMSDFVDLFAHNLHMGYGWGIILVTLIIRLIILPLGLYQAHKATYTQEKTAYLKPVFEPLNQRLKEAQTPEAKMAAQQALMQAQKDNGVNMFASLGCLPMLIQWPFFIALYNAAAYTQGITTASFFGINLGHPSVLLAVISGIFYLIQTYISTIGMPEEQKRTSRMMLIMSPAMIFVFSLISPAGVSLYWAVGGIVMVLQQVIVTFIIKPRLRKRIEKEFELNPPKMVDLPKDVTPAAATAQGLDNLISSARKDVTPSAGGRNAGKQNRKN
ncbi:membrane protein insertase YidC [Lactococcus termiticola]|uniref:Membrane protein insertase YidC n=1 Tax=Lactococcus termiticola TaxID=2169526 RepID=A0A2R5HH33_9LACT|nr:membrane protein insertase YidC [Lactococcus termiticola]GBG97292.1 preprotein translocase subunit YidC [Lactococcus termiticola]